MIEILSGARTNLKVGGGHQSGAKRNFLVVSLDLLALTVQLVVLVSAFVMISTVWSVSCLLFFYSRCPPCPAFVKVGTCPQCHMQSAPLEMLRGR